MLVTSLSQYRAKFAVESVQAVSGRVFNQNLSEGQYAIPLILQFTDNDVPENISVLAEVWGTDNVGEQVRVIDHISVMARVENLGDGTYGLPLLIQPEEVPTGTTRFESLALRVIQFSESGDYDDILFGKQEVLVTGFD